MPDTSGQPRLKILFLHKILFRATPAGRSAC